MNSPIHHRQLRPNDRWSLSKSKQLMFMIEGAKRGLVELKALMGGDSDAGRKDPLSMNNRKLLTETSL